jgi:hypothetical protein
VTERANVVAALRFHKAGHNCVPPEADTLRRPAAQSSLIALILFINFADVQSIPMNRGLDLGVPQPTLPLCCSATMA